MSDDIKKVIAENLKRARLQTGLSQDEVRQKLGYKSTGTISQHENGTKTPQAKELAMLAKIYNVSIGWIYGNTIANPYSLRNVAPMPKGGVSLPILGKVVAGQPTEALEDILGYIEISPEQTGVHFALQIKGDSMASRIEEGDIVLVQKDFVLHDGDVVIVSINGDESTCKQVFRNENGLLVQAFNTAVFTTQFFNNEQIDLLPVSILGKVVGLNRRF